MSEAGAVRVAVRVRPMNSREIKKNAKCIVQMKGKQTMLSNPNAAQEDIKKFTYDHSYWSYDRKDKHFTDQPQVFEDLGTDVLKAAFDGYNACVFAYGQTGAGKSFTMMGYGEEIGLIPRICENLFMKVAEETNETTKFSAVVSYLEIYNEKVRDLLVSPTAKGTKAPSKNLRVREHPTLGPFVDGLSTHEVADFAAIEALMELGNSNRTTAATGMNDTSSRSHSVFTIEFKQASFEHGLPSEKTSKINLVDLAGSERTSSTGATGQRLVEGGNINKSLTTLGLCISALAKRSEGGGSPGKKSFIPYRDSVLTWLLKESLGGNSKTMMVAAISPADINYGETLSTLHYANRAKNIVNKPTVNEDENVRIIRELRAEVDRLKDLLGGDEEIARLEEERKAAQDALDAAGTDEERATAQAALDKASASLSEAKTADQAVLAAQLAKSEEMMQAMVGSWKGKFDSMNQIMEDRALALKNDGRALAIESEQPHFVSLNLDDPLSTGIVLYYVHEGATTIGRQGSEPEPDISLGHDDVEALHCTVDYDGDAVVMLAPHGDAMVLVNGMRVVDSMELHQGSTVQLGQNTMFRFNHPVEAARLRQERAEGGDGATDGSVLSVGQLLGDKMRRDQEAIRSAQERLVALEAQQKERDEAEQRAVEQRLAEQAEEEARREREEQEREELRKKELEKLQAQIEQLQKAKEDESRRQRELEEAQRLESEAERARLAALEEELEAERKRRDELEEARRLNDEEAVAAQTANLAEMESLREQKEREHEARKREIEEALRQSREDQKRQEAEAERIRQEFKAEEARRKKEAEESEKRLAKEKLALQEEYNKKMEELAAAQDKLQAKGSSRLQYAEVWNIKVTEYKFRGDHYVFKIEISLLGERWSLWRRFSHFKDLHRLMKTKMKNVATHVSFPPEHRLTTSLRKSHLSDEFLRQRASDLENYLNELVQKSFRNAASPFHEVDRSILERNWAFFRKGGLSQ